jgi:hypothetical protein
MFKLTFSTRKLLTHALVLFATFGAIGTAQAYDTDTHFYETYMMARYVGIGHDVALHLATFNEFVDNNAMTSPMNPLILTGERMRRLFHFPVPLMDRYSYGSGSKQFGVKVNSLDTAQENSPMGNELVWTGLKKGDMDMVGAGLHVLMDTYGHSDYSPSLGHLYQGHGPDRSFQYYEKHQRMSKTLINVLSLIRKTLPESALDKNYRDGEGPAHIELDGAALFEKYNKNEKIQSLIKRNTLRDPRYTRYVVDFMIREAKARKIFAPEFDPQKILDDQALWATNPTVDEVITGLAHTALTAPKAEREKLVNMKTVTEWVMKDFGRNEAKFDRMTEDEKAAFTAEFARRIFSHIVPKEISKNHPVMFEYDHGIRKAEMLVRISDRQALIEEMYGTRVAFTDKVYDKAAKEITKAVLGGKTFDGAGEIEQMEMRVTQMENLNLAQSTVGTPTSKQRRAWKWKMFKYIYLDLAVGAVGYELKKAKLIGEKTEIGNTRFDPSRGAALFQRERAFELMMAFGIIKKLASDKDIAALRAGHDEENAKLREAGLATDVDAAIKRVSEEFKGKTLGDLVDSTIAPREKSLQCRDLFAK